MTVEYEEPLYSVDTHDGIEWVPVDGAYGGQLYVWGWYQCLIAADHSRPVRLMRDGEVVAQSGEAK